MINRKIFLLIFLLMLCSGIVEAQIESCANCGNRLLNSRDLKDKTKEELSLLRNEIYARKGYRFATDQYSRYFENQDWYKPLASNDEVVLSDIEKQNVDFLKQEEQKLQQQRDFALRDLKELKQALNDGDAKIIAKYLPVDSREEWQEEMPNYLKSILDRIDLDDIHWNKNCGLYKVSIDNGYYINIYSIRIDKDKIEILGTDTASHSENFGDFDDGYSDYMSEGETSIIFTFDITDKGIAYKNVMIAG